MWEHEIWIPLLISSVISFSISAWAGLKLTSFWLKLVVFVLCIFLGLFLSAFLGAVWASLHPVGDADGSILIALHNALPGFLGALIAMTWSAMWLLPWKVSELMNRIRSDPKIRPLRKSN
jgi:hypothetical protein